MKTSIRKITLRNVVQRRINKILHTRRYDYVGIMTEFTGISFVLLILMTLGIAFCSAKPQHPSQSTDGMMPDAKTQHEKSNDTLGEVTKKTITTTGDNLKKADQEIDRTLNETGDAIDKIVKDTGDSLKKTGQKIDKTVDKVIQDTTH